MRAPNLPFRLWPDVGDPAQVRYLAAWMPPEDMAATFPNLELVFSVGAGVDQFDVSRLPPHIPLIRMLEPGIAESMVECVTMAVLALHRDLVHFTAEQREQIWRETQLTQAAKRRVGVMGLGLLGQTVLERLKAFGLPVGTARRAPSRMSADGRAGAPGFPGADRHPGQPAAADRSDPRHPDDEPDYRQC